VTTPRQFLIAGPNSDGHPLGTICYEAWVPDYGLSSQDTRETGYEHVSVTLDPSGGYPTFTIRREHLKESLSEQSKP
jgi:hypothetical protein